MYGTCMHVINLELFVLMLNKNDLVWGVKSSMFCTLPSLNNVNGQTDIGIDINFANQ